MKWHYTEYMTIKSIRAAVCSQGNRNWVHVNSINYRGVIDFYYLISK